MARSNFQHQVTFYVEQDFAITGVQVMERTTRELECSKSGGGRVNFALFAPLGAGAAFRGGLKTRPTGQVPVWTRRCTGEDPKEGHSIAETAGADKNASS